jgi:putative transposase
MTKTPYDPQHHHRCSIRLKGYDYAQAGAYFVTLCTQNRVCLFGDITDGEMRLNDAGQLVLTVWNELPVHYAGVDIDAFVIMPNHIHGIIVLSVGTVGAGPRACPQGRPRGGAPTMSLPDVVHRFKTLTTKRYTDGVKQSNWPPFPGKVWQRNYYERVIRGEAELGRARRYIETNPAQWQTDTESGIK